LWVWLDWIGLDLTLLVCTQPKDEEFEWVRIGYAVSRMPAKTCHNLVLFPFNGLLVNEAFIIVHEFWYPGSNCLLSSCSALPFINVSTLYLTRIFFRVTNEKFRSGTSVTSTLNNFNVHLFSNIEETMTFLHLAWFQAFAAKQLRTALFWVITRRVVVISYRRFEITYYSFVWRSSKWWCRFKCIAKTKTFFFWNSS